MYLLYQRFRCRHTRITDILRRREVTRCRTHGTQFARRSLRKYELIRWADALSTRRRLELPVGTVTEITRGTAEVRLYIDEVAGCNTDFISANEAKGVATRIRMIELLWNLCVAACNSIRNTRAGKRLIVGAECEHSSVAEIEFLCKAAYDLNL